MLATIDEKFRVARRWAATPFDLVRQSGGQMLLKDFYQPVTPWLKAIGYGMFALTNNEPDQFQEVTARDLLEVIEVAWEADGARPVRFHGQHYLDAFEALKRLFNVAIPMKTKRVRREGRRWVKEERIDTVRLIDGFGIVYLNPGTGKPLDVGNDPRYQPFRVDINSRPAAMPNPRGRRPRKREFLPDDSRPVWAMVRVDRAGDFVLDGDGNPVLRTPDRYRFRWSRDVIADLMVTREGRGWLDVNRAIFRVLRNIRRSGNGRGCPTASHLLDLIISDLLGKGETRQVLEKPAKLIFATLGLSEPGSLSRGARFDRDGRWAENVNRIAHAIRLLKAEGVLLAESDEMPYVDPNPDRRTAPYYRWRRAPQWTFPIAVRIVDERPTSPLALPESKAPPAANPLDVQGLLFEDAGPVTPPIRGRDIRAAREAAGLTLRQFSTKIGGCAFNQWARIEREEISRRTGRPLPVPPRVADRVAAFLAEYSPKAGSGEFCI